MPGFLSMVQSPMGYVRAFAQFKSTDIGGQSVAAKAAGVQRLPTDSVGGFSLSLANMVVGSSILITDGAGSTRLNSTVAATSETYLLAAYAVGAASNTLSIKIRKGTAAPFYQPYETLVTAFVGSQSVYINQLPD